MSTDASEIFRVSWRSPLVISGAAFFVLVLLVLGIGALPFVLACGGVWLAVTLFVPAVTVRDDGLVLYCVNRLLWHQVIAVRAGKVLGQPYLMVTRHAGGFRCTLQANAHSCSRSLTERPWVVRCRCVPPLRHPAMHSSRRRSASRTDSGVRLQPWMTARVGRRRVLERREVSGALRPDETLRP